MTDSGRKSWENDCKKGWETAKKEYCYWVPQADIEGRIPEDLHGTFFRNGPGLNEVYGKKLKHPIDGDGMICAITFTGQNVHFRSKFVASKHRLEEESKKQFIYMGQMGTRNTNVFFDTMKAVTGLAFGVNTDWQFRNPSNTNVFYWGGKLLSCYETSMPICLDPRSLETLGQDNLNGHLKLGCLGAHFRTDSTNKRLVCFSQRPGLRRPPYLVIYEFNEDWSLHQKVISHITGLNYMHDFALLPDYYLVHITPFVKVSAWQTFKIATGFTSPGESMRYYSELPSKFVLIPRDPSKNDQTITVDTDPFHIFHFGTASQYEDEVTFVAPCLGKGFNMDFDKEIWLSNSSVAPGFLRSVKIDLKQKTCETTVVDRATVEFPTIHPYRNGINGTRFNYLMSNDRPGEHLPYRDVVKFNAMDGSREVWYSEGVIGEPVFVPRLGYESRDHGDEDDGYVLVQLYHPEKHISSFCVLDAKNISKGYIAKINLKHHVPYGFHGTFSPEVFVSPFPPVVKSKL